MAWLRTHNNRRRNAPRRAKRRISPLVWQFMKLAARLEPTLRMDTYKFPTPESWEAVGKLAKPLVVFDSPQVDFAGAAYLDALGEPLASKYYEEVRRLGENHK